MTSENYYDSFSSKRRKVKKKLMNFKMWDCVFKHGSKLELQKYVLDSFKFVCLLFVFFLLSLLS